MMFLKRGLMLALAITLAGCGQSARFAGRYAVTPGGVAQIRITTDGSLYVLEKYQEGAWGERRELGRMDCPEALHTLEKTLAEQRPELVCLGRGGEVAAALLYLDAPRAAWQHTHYYLIIGLPLPLYKIQS